MNKLKSILIITCIVSQFNISYSEDQMSLSSEKSKNITSGNIQYHCEYTHEARPYVHANSINERIENSNGEKQLVTFDYDLVISFLDNKLRVDLNQPSSEFYPNPILQTFVYDGNKLSMYSHTNNFVSTIYELPYREGHVGTLYYPPKAFGYDVNTVIGLVAKSVNQQGEKPTLSVTTIGNTTRIIGEYLSSNETTVLAHIEWSDEHEGIFSRCVYKQPKTPSYVEIITSDFQNYEGILYPNFIVAKQIIANDFEDIEDGKVASEQVLNVVDAEFNVEIEQSYLSANEFSDYYNLEEARQKLRQEHKLSQN